jgi:hypothetical protein
MGIVLINQSSHISDAEVGRIAEACDRQLAHDVGPAWNIAKPLNITVATAPVASAYPFFLVDAIPEAPGALAYHFVQPDGVPAGKIGVETTLQAGETVAGATSHEAVELQCDVFCASWSYSKRLACLVATEACDPVQADSYTITVGDGTAVPVSNFVTPAYFTDDPLGQPLDHLGNLHQTYGIARGGYQIRMKAGKVSNVYGEDFPDALRIAKERSQGRTFWRNVTMAIALSS